MLDTMKGDNQHTFQLKRVMAKKVSVILVSYNGMPHLDACISSVLKQSHTNFEVIFVDNNSSDGSLEYARSKFPNLIFVTNNENLGYAGGINAGLAHATGEYIAPLNIDTEVTPNWLGSMVSFLDENPHAGAITPKVLLFEDRTKINALGLNIHVTGLGFCRSLGKDDDILVIPENVPGVSGCSYLIRRQLLEQMGGAPGWCFMGNDDVIVSWLLRLMGYEVYCLPESIVFHKYSLKMNPEKLFRLEKNRQTLLLSTLKPLTLLICLPILLAIELMILVYSLARGRLYIRAKFDALASLWRERSNIKRMRAQYQLLRKISDFALFRRLNWNLEWTQLLHTVR
jgi:GT2 family glycosyltransferase